MRRRVAEWLSWRGPLASTVLVPAGVACAAGAIVAHLLTPHWRMGGYTFAYGYPKNVEINATLAGLAAGAAAAVLVRWRATWAAAWLVALAGFGTAHLLWPLAVATWLPGLGLAAGLAIGLETARNGGLADPGPATATSAGAAAAWCAGLTLLTLMSYTPLLVVDAYHDGSVLLSAVDFVRGGFPFHSYIWAHGLHDTGVAALWILITGKIGTSAVALTNATVAALSVPTLLLIARRAVSSAAAALLAAATGLVGVVAVGSFTLGGAGGVLFLLRSIGILVFVAVAFFCATTRPRPHLWWTGAALAMAHLWRFEVGVGGAVAVAVVVAYRALVEAPRRRGAAVIGNLARVASGAVLFVALWHALFGWPDAAWLQNVFALGAYHSGYNGLPFAWPRSGESEWTRGVVWAGVTMAVALMLLATAARRVVDALWPPPGTHPAAAAPRDTELLILLALLAAAGLRTALDRSDTLHIAMWSLVPAWGAALPPLAAHFERLAARPRWAHAGLAMLALFLWFRDPPQQRFLQHLRPNPPLGPCADTTFTAAEAAVPRNWVFIEDTCMTELVLRAHGVERLIIDHSAPWYSVRFGLPQLMPQYMLNQAVTPAAQRALIDHWRAVAPQALLQVRGYSGLGHYDVHNMHQVPVLEAYLRARRDGTRRLRTPIGVLYLLDEAAEPSPRAAPRLLSDEVALFVDRAVFDPATGFAEAQGWAADLVGGEPVADISWWRDDAPDATAETVEPMRRLDVVAAMHASDLEFAGWWLVTRGAAGPTPPRFRLRAVTADGRTRIVDVDPERVQRLPPRSGAEWASLGADVAVAERQGAADRAAALARHAGAPIVQ
ncbi:MAG: hypothetical protein ABI629_09515 [bacterium]